MYIEAKLQSLNLLVVECVAQNQAYVCSLYHLLFTHYLLDHRWNVSARHLTKLTKLSYGYW
jgi:hypothetical protein